MTGQMYAVLCRSIQLPCYSHNHFPSWGAHTPLFPDSRPFIPRFLYLLQLPSSVAIKARLPRSPSNRTQDYISTIEPTTKELVGQSGRHYHIERVLQEKEFPNGISPLRVYIASCVPLKVNSIPLLTQAHPSAENQNSYWRIFSQKTSKAVWICIDLYAAVVSTSITRYHPRRSNTCIPLFYRSSPKSRPERSTSCSHETNPQRYTAGAGSVTWSKHCSHG